MAESGPWIGLAGPTASGKSAVALALAEQLQRQGLGVEIISVDSALVYRGMDVGTAKPSLAEQALVRHHLIDILEPTQAYSAQAFVTQAQALVTDIRQRGHVPLLVGGTMLYFKALTDGLDPLPPANPALRADLEARASQLGWPALHAELAQVDPATAARLAPNDSQRIQRALEVYAISGQALSSFHTIKSRANKSTGISQNLFISLEPADRGWLHARIAQRFDAMLGAGLVDEVAALRARGDLHPDLPSMRCVGYRQTLQMLDGQLSRADLREHGIAATRQLAKRQLTWLRSMPARQTIACDQTEPLLPVLEQVCRFVENTRHAGQNKG
jgi:tRNA dimethylallyltransferase